MAESKMKSMAEILAEHPLFAGLDPKITKLLGGCGTNRHFSAGSYIFKADGPADIFYLLRAGDVVLFKASHGQNLDQVVEALRGTPAAPKTSANGG